MKSPRHTLTRRRFVTVAALAGLTSIPVVLGTRGALAADMPRLDEAEGSAKALSYVHDAAEVDAAARGGDDRICRTCRFYTDASAAPWGPCTLFPGKAVNAGGWCKGWVARTS